MIKNFERDEIMEEVNNELKNLYIHFIQGISGLHSMDLQTLKEDFIYKFLLQTLNGTLESFGFLHIFLGGVPQIEVVYCGINEKICLNLSEKTNYNEIKQIVYTSESARSHENEVACLQEKIQGSMSKVSQNPNKILYGVPFSNNFIVSEYRTKVNVLYVYYPHLHPISDSVVSIGKDDKNIDFLYNYMTLNLIKAFDSAQLGRPEDAISDAWMAIQISIGYQLEANNSKIRDNHPIKQLKALYSKEEITKGKPFLSEDIINKLNELYLLRCQVMHGEDIIVNVNELKELLAFVYIYYHYFFRYNGFNLVLQIAEEHFKADRNPVIATIGAQIVKLLAPFFI